MAADGGRWCRSPQTQRPDQGILALRSDLVESGGFLQHPLRLCRNLLTQGSQAHVTRRTLEKQGADALLDLLQRDRQRRLADMAFFRSTAKVAFAGQV